MLNLFNRTRRPHQIAKTHVAMLHTGRTGSTVLGAMLNRHSKVSWASEIYQRFETMNKSEQPKDMFAAGLNFHKTKPLHDIFGFEVKYLSNQQLSEKVLNMKVEKYIALAGKLNDIRYIGLNRKNHLRHMISYYVGNIKGYWHTTENESPQMVEINPQRARNYGIQMGGILDWFDHLDMCRERLRQQLPENSLLLTYEDDIMDDPRVAYRKVCEFLGIEDEEPEISYKKTNPFSYEKMISNFDEVASTLRGTRHEWMLEH